MGKRHHSRQLALQILYARDFVGEAPPHIAQLLIQTEHISASHWTDFCKQLAAKTIEQQESLDAEITKTLANWRIERLSKVDLIILRLALCEMRCFADVPIRVTLNEYIELAKQFGTEDSSAFVNGILDRLAQQFQAKDFAQETEAED